MSYCSGQSLATITSTAWPGLQVNPSVLAHVACWVGETLRHFHAMDVNILAKAISPSFGATPCASLGAIKQAGHCHAACPPSQLSERPRELTQVGYMQFLRKLRASCVARHLRKWNIPDHLWLQMDAYLPPFDRIGYVPLLMCFRIAEGHDTPRTFVRGHFRCCGALSNCNVSFWFSVFEMFDAGSLAATSFAVPVISSCFILISREITF